MMCTLGDDVCGMSLLCRRERPQICTPSIATYLCNEPSFLHRYAKQSDLGAFHWFAFVLVVDRVRHIAKIGYLVVMLDAIDVINLLIWSCAMYFRPSIRIIQYIFALNPPALRPMYLG